MYSNIMVPVDLAHQSTVDKAIKVAVDLARLYGAGINLVGVTASTPSAVAHNEAEYAEKLASYTQDMSVRHDYPMQSRAVHNNDPAVELEGALLDTCEDLGADLVVMASHVPTFMDHFFRSNASQLATDSNISILIVR